jgi:hypothetical protein
MEKLNPKKKAELLDALHGMKVDSMIIPYTSTVKIIHHGVEIADTFKVRGITKKEIALDVITELADFADIILDYQMVGETIDLVLAASKGEVNINKTVKFMSKVIPVCCLGLSSCFSKKKKVPKKEQNGALKKSEKPERSPTQRV